MANYQRLVNSVIKRADIIIIALDARAWKESRNKEIENKIKKEGKQIVYVITKADLISAEDAKKIKLKNAVVLSVKQHKNTMTLMRLLSRMSENKRITVGVLGYPNAGKSSLINALKGRKSAPVSSRSGFTKSLRKVKVKSNIYLIDTPGVFPKKEFDEFKHAIIAAKDVTRLSDPETIAEKLMENYPGKIEEYMGVPATSDYWETLEKIALKKKMLKKKGEADTKRAAQHIIKLMQEGKIPDAKK